MLLLPMRQPMRVPARWLGFHRDHSWGVHTSGMPRKIRAAPRIKWRSSAIARRSSGRCTFTATSPPPNRRVSVARYTWRWRQQLNCWDR